MASGGDDDKDAVLSDFEDDDPVPISIKDSSSNNDVSVERLRELVAELDREKQARLAAENAKSELQVSFNRLKVLAHEAIRKRDECSRQRDEVLLERDAVSKSKEKLSAELAEASRVRDEVLLERDAVFKSKEKLSAELAEASRVRDEVAKQLEEAVKAKESSRSEIETAAQMLVTGIEKISGKVSNIKNFMAGGLPRSQKYTGLPAVAYGVIKRTNEIVEELVKQIDLTAQSRNEAREQMDQRNYEIAIEVSELEATISGLREEVLKRKSAVENLEKSVAEKDVKISEIERELVLKQNLARDYDEKVRNLESRMESQRPLLVDQLSYVAKIHDQVHNVIKTVDANMSDQSDFSESLFLPQETDVEENIRASLAGLESTYDLSRIAVEKTRDLADERRREVKSLNESVNQLVKEKEHIGSLLRSALSRRMSTDLSSKTNELFKVTENGLREAGIDYKFSDHKGDGKVAALNGKAGNFETEDDEIYGLAGALENIIKQSQLEIIELQHTVEELRTETSLLRQHVELQAKELTQRKQRVEELEEKERMANENVEGLMMDIAAAEEEISRWKVAAQEEAEAGKAIEQEFLAQLTTIRQELEEAKQAVIESDKKLKFKEETAVAAMAARDAAENSLKLADLRATRLRERIEELTHQLEGQDSREALRSGGQSRPRYTCWPWEWLGMNFVGFQKPITQHQLDTSNEMELAEPLL